MSTNKRIKFTDRKYPGLIFWLPSQHLYKTKITKHKQIKLYYIDKFGHEWCDFIDLSEINLNYLKQALNNDDKNT